MRSVRVSACFMMMMVVSVTVMVVIVMVAVVRGLGRHKEALSRQAFPPVRHEAAVRAGAESERRNRRSHLGPEVREGVESGGHEHVAGPAAERIDMYLQNPRLHPAPRRYSGLTVT